MCLVWEPTVNNTVRLRAGSGKSNSTYPLSETPAQSRPSPPGRRTTGAGAGSVFSLARTKLHFTTPPRQTWLGSDRNTLLVLPAAPALGPGPPRQAGERSRGWAAGRRRPEGSRRPGREGRSAGRAGRRYLSPQLILQLCREAAGGKGRKCPVSPLPKGTLLLQAAIKGAFAVGRPAFW